MKSICKIEGCGIHVEGLGLCRKHYSRLKRGADLYKKNTREKTAKERLMDSCEPVTETGCWIWMLSTDIHGYGQITYKKEHKKAPRFSYTIFVGAVPKGMMVLHKCDIRSCINPDHLYIGNAKQNVRDAVNRGRHRNQFMGITHCKNGHEFNKENTKHYRGKRICKACQTMASRERYLRERYGRGEFAEVKSYAEK